MVGIHEDCRETISAALPRRMRFRLLQVAAARIGSSTCVATNPDFNCAARCRAVTLGDENPCEESHGLNVRFLAYVLGDGVESSRESIHHLPDFVVADHQRRRYLKRLT